MTSLSRMRGIQVVLAVGLLWTFGSCTRVERLFKPQPQRPPSGFFIHQVRWPGESLSIIAKWYTGNMGNWQALARVNRKLDPEHITIGTRIRIPARLLRTRKPMPRRFVAGFTPAKKAPLHKPTPVPSGEEELEIFGPR